MNDAERVELVAYKMSRAKETLAEVDLQIKNKLFHTAVNRLYYACFYAVSALLIDNEIKARKHAGVKQMFGLHFVSTGIIDEESGAFYTSIFTKRQKGDYEDFVYFTENEIVALLSPAGKLISRIEEIILKKS
jgi:uncharacterized protein (UPF0332 family)